MKILNYLSVLIIPLLTIVIVVYGLLKRKPVFAIFHRGAEKGLKITVQLMPTWIGLLTATGVLRASGLLEKITQLLKQMLKNSRFPTEVLPVLLVRLFSSSAGFVSCVWTGLGSWLAGFCVHELHRDRFLYHERLFCCSFHKKWSLYTKRCIIGNDSRNSGKFCDCYIFVK